MKRVPFAEIDGAPYRAWWIERFAPDADPFAALRFYRRGKNNVWVGNVDLAGLERTQLDAVGVHLLRIGRRMWKPTSTAIVAFGGGARRNLFEAGRDEAAAFLAGHDLEIAAEDPRRDGVTRGFIAVRYGGVALGCGEWHERGVLVSLIPRNQCVDGIDI
jgi:NOL1/NOP2/fmu family ribosome biogenesis protein